MTFSYDFLATTIPNFLETAIPHLDITHFLPVVPDRIFSSVRSGVVAAGAGYAYGYIGRVIYPNSGISPLNYAVGFALAFQIKQFAVLLEDDFRDFLGVGNYLENLEKLSESELDLEDFVRCRCWKMIQFKNQILKEIDCICVKVLHIRPYEEVTKKNVEESSFLEMCRYRIGPVFKLAVLEMLSFSISYRLSNGMGFSLPPRTSAPLIVVISSIINEIIFIPGLYVYVRWSNQVGDQIDGNDAYLSAQRAKWIRSCLPPLTPVKIS